MLSSWKENHYSDLSKAPLFPLRFAPMHSLPDTAQYGKPEAIDPQWSIRPSIQWILSRRLKLTPIYISKLRIFNSEESDTRVRNTHYDHLTGCLFTDTDLFLSWPGGMTEWVEWGSASRFGEIGGFKSIWFKPWWSQTNDFKIDTCRFLARQLALLGSGKDWSAQCQDNVTEWASASFGTLVSQWAALLGHHKCLLSQVGTCPDMTLNVARTWNPNN